MFISTALMVVFMFIALSTCNKLCTRRLGVRQGAALLGANRRRQQPSTDLGTQTVVPLSRTKPSCASAREPSSRRRTADFSYSQKRSMAAGGTGQRTWQSLFMSTEFRSPTGMPMQRTGDTSSSFSCAAASPHCARNSFSVVAITPENRQHQTTRLRNTSRSRSCGADLGNRFQRASVKR
jgi:hypothetical protein